MLDLLVELYIFVKFRRAVGVQTARCIYENIEIKLYNQLSVRRKYIYGADAKKVRRDGISAIFVNSL